MSWRLMDAIKQLVELAFPLSIFIYLFLFNVILLRFILPNVLISFILLSVFVVGVISAEFNLSIFNIVKTLRSRFLSALSTTLLLLDKQIKGLF
jgi:hypothetical protein